MRYRDLGMLLNYLKIGAIVKNVKKTYPHVTKEKKLQFINQGMLEKGFSQKDYIECMSFITQLLNEEEKNKMVSPLIHDTVTKESMEDSME